jgi:hypothetical protein
MVAMATREWLEKLAYFQQLSFFEEYFVESSSELVDEPEKQLLVYPTWSLSFQ